jgi:hypothetical protein
MLGSLGDGNVKALEDWRKADRAILSPGYALMNFWALGQGGLGLR